MENTDEDSSKNSSAENKPVEEIVENSVTDVTSEDEQTPKRPKKPLLEQLQAQLRRNQKKRFQTRDYGRILGESQTPASWYKTPAATRSIYFYDPQHPKNSSLQVAQPTRIDHSRIDQMVPPSPPPSRLQVQPAEHSLQQLTSLQRRALVFTPRTKYILDLYNTAVTYHHRRQRSHTNQNLLLSKSQESLSSRLKTVPKLPTIVSTSQTNESSMASFDRDDPQLRSTSTINKTPRSEIISATNMTTLRKKQSVK